MSPYYIIDIVCRCLEINWHKLVSIDKHRKYTDARFIAILIMRDRVKMHDEIKKMPYSEIAYIFKRKTHKSALDAEYEAKKLIKTDKEFKKKYDIVINLLDSNVSVG